MGSLVRQVLKVIKDLLGSQDRPDLKEMMVPLVPPDLKELLGFKESLVPQAPPVHRVIRVRQESPELLVHKELLV